MPKRKLPIILPRPKRQPPVKAQRRPGGMQPASSGSLGVKVIRKDGVTLE